MYGEFSLAPGAVNFVHDPRYWAVDFLPRTGRKMLGYFRGIPIIQYDTIDRPVVMRPRFVLPIRGAGNDRV